MGLLLLQVLPELTHLNTARGGVCFRRTMICCSCRGNPVPHPPPNLCPSVLRELGQQSRRGPFLPDERCLQVVDRVSLVLPDCQTQAADQPSILDAVHVERLPVVLLAGRRPRLTVTLVLRQKSNKWMGQQRKQKKEMKTIGDQRVEVGGDSALLSQRWLAATRWRAELPNRPGAVPLCCGSWGTSEAGGGAARWNCCCCLIL